MQSLSPYVFVTIYLLVDIFYVTISRSVYNPVIKSISGSEIPFEKPGFLFAALFAYASMAIAWLFLVVPTVHYMISKGTQKWLAGIIAGVVYGLAVYGVFNGTLYTMFVGWNSAIFIRDMTWGISWATILTTLFSLSLKD